MRNRCINRRLTIVKYRYPTSKFKSKIRSTITSPPPDKPPYFAVGRYQRGPRLPRAVRAHAGKAPDHLEGQLLLAGGLLNVGKACAALSQSLATGRARR